MGRIARCNTMTTLNTNVKWKRFRDSSEECACRMANFSLLYLSTLILQEDVKKDGAHTEILCVPWYLQKQMSIGSSFAILSNFYGVYHFWHLIQKNTLY